MGAGCYYTHKETGTRAFWVDVDPYYTDEDGQEQHDEFAWQDEVGNIGCELEALGYKKSAPYEWQNGLFTVTLASGHGNEVVIYMNPAHLYGREYSLAMATHERSSARIKRHLLKQSYPLRIATSGYTSEAVPL